MRGTIGILLDPEMPPDDTSIISILTSRKAEANLIESANVQLPPLPSTADNRKNTGFSFGHTSRTAAATSTANRIRLANEPP